MPERPAYSVAARLTLFFVLFFGVVTFTGGAALYQLVTRHVASELDGDIARDMDEFARIAGHGNLAALQEAFTAFEKASGKDDCFARLIDDRGRVLAATHMENWGGISTPEPQAAIATVALPDGRLKARILSMPVAGVGTLQIGVSLVESEKLAANFRRYGFIVLALILALGAPLGWWLARSAMAGVETVTRTARSVAAGNFSDRVEVPGHGREIDALVRAFNLMVDRVQGVMGEMRHVNDNIAHDLRSPLTRIRGLAEQAVLDCQGTGPGAELAGTIVEECDRLRLMIDTMLDISEAEAGVGRLQIELVDLAELAGQAVELFSGVAEERGVRLDFSPVGPVNVPGDRRGLQRVMANLIDNAIKYTPRGGRVAVAAARHGDRAEFSVSDSGIGIAAADLPRIFDRFYRADASRHQSGNGLGLSLAQAIARAHGGSLTVSSSPGAGSTFTLGLPA